MELLRPRFIETQGLALCYFFPSRRESAILEAANTVPGVSRTKTLTHVAPCAMPELLRKQTA
jgi:hypothetical protein